MEITTKKCDIEVRKYMIHRLAAQYRSLSVLLRVKVVTSDFKKFYMTISCHGFITDTEYVLPSDLSYIWSFDMTNVKFNQPLKLEWLVGVVDVALYSADM